MILPLGCWINAPFTQQLGPASGRSLLKHHSSEVTTLCEVKQHTPSPFAVCPFTLPYFSSECLPLQLTLEHLKG